jgi:hypothetical protein
VGSKHVTSDGAGGYYVSDVSTTSGASGAGCVAAVLLLFVGAILWGVLWLDPHDAKTHQKELVTAEQNLSVVGQTRVKLSKPLEAGDRNAAITIHYDVTNHDGKKHVLSVCQMMLTPGEKDGLGNKAAPSPACVHNLEVGPHSSLHGAKVSNGLEWHLVGDLGEHTLLPSGRVYIGRIDGDVVAPVDV